MSKTTQEHTAQVVLLWEPKSDETHTYWDSGSAPEVNGCSVLWVYVFKNINTLSRQVIPSLVLRIMGKASFYYSEQEVFTFSVSGQ